jgi:hypothetical protein
MRVRIQIAIVLLLTCAASGSAASGSRRAKKKSTDLFESFRQLDRQFTNLDTQFKDLQESVRRGKAESKRSWRQSARDVRKTTAHIEVVSARMYAHYRRSGRKFAYRNFAVLRGDARRLHARTLRISSAKSSEVARRETQLAKQAMLDLVLQYQALSGGYAAARCDAGAWVCGTPKPEPRRLDYPREGVRWTCVPRANACKGLLGPRAPKLAPEPLTAGAAVR